VGNSIKISDKKMKGITPVIAIILLLLITISMVGFAFVWFSRVTSDTGQQIGVQANQVTNNAQKRVTIEAVSATGITVRNSGTAQVQLVTTASPAANSEVAVYLGGSLQTPTWSANTLAAGGVASATFTCTTTQQVKVTSPGGTDLNTCP
jgi:flagellin-like protein